MENIRSLTSDIKPDNWITFYLFYFNQGIGSDASFRLHNLQIHIFIGSSMSAANNGIILDVLKKKHALAVGEFMHILAQLMINDQDLRIKSSTGAALHINTDNGNAESVLFNNDEEIKSFMTALRSSPGVIQLH